MTISVKSRKQKGRKFQQQVAKEISKLIGIPIEKDGDLESRPMAQSGSDVILRGEAKKLFPFDSIECKNQEKLNIWQSLKQAESYGDKFLLFFKRNRSDIYVALKAKDFFDLLRKVLKGSDKSEDITKFCEM